MRNLERKFKEREKKSDFPTKHEEEWRKSDLLFFKNILNNKTLFNKELKINNNERENSIILKEDSLSVSQNLNLSLGFEINKESLEKLINLKTSQENKYTLLLKGEIEKAIFIDLKEDFLNIEIDNNSDNIFLNPIYIKIRENTNSKVTIKINSKSFNIILINVLQEKNSSIHFEIIDLSKESLVFSNINIKKDSKLNAKAAILGNSYNKCFLEYHLLEDNITANLSGIYLSRERERKEIFLLQKHYGKNSYTNSLYKSYVNDNAYNIFQGLINIEEEASGSDAYLTNNNMIAKDGARSDSMPMLEIKNNDVKCSHGSTTSKIKEDELFYLMNRGYSREEGTNTLIMNFFTNIIDSFNENLKEELYSLIESKIYKKLS